MTKLIEVSRSTQHPYIAFEHPPSYNNKETERRAAAALTDDGDDVGLGEKVAGERVGGEALGCGLRGVRRLGHVVAELS
ncbi:hypothetical protein E2C01_046411 [Portunus trituberculatus]|uniref:Uncharacterized protein n=1 Tax=Portunus trituberculatus TaxID=210409 RepID=A0A5B7FXU0_PORTR|nr:hypothetical protein [Portunus trituberculatus]